MLIPGPNVILKGIFIYLQPVKRTYNIPFITILSSILGLPILDLGGKNS